MFRWIMRRRRMKRMIMLQDEANDHDSAEDEVDDPDVEGGDAKGRGR